MLGDAARNAAVTAETAVPKFRFGTSKEVWDRDLLLKQLEVNWDHLLSGMEDSCQITSLGWINAPIVAKTDIE